MTIVSDASRIPPATVSAVCLRRTDDGWVTTEVGLLVDAPGDRGLDVDQASCHAAIPASRPDQGSPNVAR